LGQYEQIIALDLVEVSPPSTPPIRPLLAAYGFWLIEERFAWPGIEFLTGKAGGKRRATAPCPWGVPDEHLRAFPPAGITRGDGRHHCVVGRLRAEDDGITAGFSTIILADQFFVRLQKGMDDAAARLGVTMIHNNPDGDPTAQFKAVENFITQGVDVVIVDAIDPNGIQPALRAAQEAGIPVIAVDEVLDGVEVVTAGVGLSNSRSARRWREASPWRANSCPSSSATSTRPTRRSRMRASPASGAWSMRTRQDADRRVG
jgi:hypothetical protein